MLLRVGTSGEQIWGKRTAWKRFSIEMELLNDYTSFVFLFPLFHLSDTATFLRFVFLQREPIFLLEMNQESSSKEETKKNWGK